MNLLSFIQRGQAGQKAADHEIKRAVQRSIEPVMRETSARWDEAKQVIKLCESCQEALARCRDFAKVKSMDQPTRDFLATAIVQVGRCAFQTAEQLREGK